MVLGDTSLWYEVKVLIWPRKTVWLFWLLLLLQIGLLFCNNVKSLVLFFSISFALIFDLVKTCQDRQTLYCKYCSLQVKFVKNLSLVVLSDDEHKLRHVRHTELSVVVLWFRGTKHFPACVLSAVRATRQNQTGAPVNPSCVLRFGRFGLSSKQKKKVDIEFQVQMRSMLTIVREKNQIASLFWILLS